MRHVILFVHGMGTKPYTLPAAFQRGITEAFARGVREAGHRAPPAEALAWREAPWADVVQPDQNALKRRLDVRGKLREFMVSSLGDVVAYAKLPYPPDKYGQIQRRFAEAMRAIAEEAAARATTPTRLTIISHSLGSVIASDGVYELQQSGQFPTQLALVNFFTMGSPIALFGLRYGLEHFTKPIRPKIWVNFFYPEDLVGYPLKPLNAAYHQAVDEDLRLAPAWASAGLWRGITRLAIAQVPLLRSLESHSWYFSDRRVSRRIGELLAQQWRS
ncbi:MAG: hypothetical protein HY737_04540 [Candidatus Omnitrophica bacterium]|nr:hypothetical protein [Candidatus Omnitrophota bacterium]